MGERTNESVGAALAKNPVLAMIRASRPIVENDLDKAKAQVCELTEKLEQYNRAEKALVEAGIE